MQQFEGQWFLHLALDDAKTKYYAYKQAYKTPLARYIKKIMTLVDVIEHYGGDLCSDPGLIAKHQPKRRKPRKTQILLSLL
jgi:hypothetical protein